MPQLQPEQPFLGFKEQASQRNPFLDQVMAVLDDPRNQMMFAPGMSLLRAPGAISSGVSGLSHILSGQAGSYKPYGWRGTRPPGETLPSMGGSNVPGKLLRSQDEMLPARMSETFGGTEPVTQEYLKNRLYENFLVDHLLDPKTDARTRTRLLEYLGSEIDPFKSNIDKVFIGKRLLKDEVTRATSNESGGFIPPMGMLDKHGLK